MRVDSVTCVIHTVCASCGELIHCVHNCLLCPRCPIRASRAWQGKPNQHTLLNCQLLPGCASADARARERTASHSVGGLEHGYSLMPVIVCIRNNSGYPQDISQNVHVIHNVIHRLDTLGGMLSTEYSQGANDPT